MRPTIYVISDGTGETAMSMIRAALVQFDQSDVNLIRCKNVRTELQVQSLIEQAAEAKSFICYTVVSPSLRAVIEREALIKNIPTVDFLGPLLSKLNGYFGVSEEGEAGKLRVVDEKYFRRIEAIEFTVKHDDGKELRDLGNADIILVGISRTSKTPLSIFLSHRGFKVANIPLVLGVPLPEILQTIDQKKIIGLTIDPSKLSRIRAKRAEKFGDSGGDYAHPIHIHKEVEYAHSLYQQNRRWPILDVTERALEETAAEITRIVCARTGIKEDPLL